MGKKAVAFQVKVTSIVGIELACGDCPVVLQVTHDRLFPLPKHRCKGRVAEFNIVIELDDLVLRPSRIDKYWLK